MRKLLIGCLVVVGVLGVTGCNTGTADPCADGRIIDDSCEPTVDKEVISSFKQLYEWNAGDGGYSPQVVYYPRGTTDSDVRIVVAFQEKATADAPYRIHLLRMTGTVNNLVVADETLVESENEFGNYLALGLLSNDSLVLAYYDDSDLSLKLMIEDSNGAWQRKTLDSLNNVGQYVAMAVDAADGVHLAYHDRGDKNIKYLLYQNGSILIDPEVVDSGIDRDEDSIMPGGDIEKKISITLDPQGDPTIAYYEAVNGFLRLAHFNSLAGAWQIEVLGEFKSKLLASPDVDGKVRLGTDFVRRPEQIDLWADGFPVPQTVTILGNDIQIPAFDPAAEYEISYVRPFSSNYGQWSSIAYDGLGVLQVAFFDFQRQLVASASNPDPFSNPAWTFMIVDEKGSVGDYCALEMSYPEGVGGGGIPFMAYYDAGNADLKTAYRKSGSWSTRTADSTGWSGLDIAMDSSNDGFMAIAYRTFDFETATGSLKVLRTIPVLEN